MVTSSKMGGIGSIENKKTEKALDSMIYLLEI